ncbi:nucleotidyltransferase family protein [Hongsoonwoonella zoysiae]|uniref:nucleotidyltransferase family protein n=1 Tax=Hongsoonwoonella zoysiae TaxID=2821844 RepID=UPI001AED9438|nr:nucleotidyltransferase family protein [Hongsoonwoonella zoysiae]
MAQTDAFRPKRAMVLSAGIGKRMRPITATTPKPLIEVAGRALIDHALDRLAKAGVETCVVNVHYLADLVEVHVSRRTSPKIVISDERDELLETGGGIAKALPHLGDEPFFLLNSDSTWIEGVTPNLEHLVRHWDETRMDVLLLLSETVTSVGYDGRGDFDMDKEGMLSRRNERSVSPFAYAGAAILHPRLFEGAPEGAFSLNVLFDRAMEDGRLFGVLMEGIWLHVGTPSAIADAERAVSESID